MTTSKTKTKTSAWVLALTLTTALAGVGCSPVSQETREAAAVANAKPVPVDPSVFLAEALVGEIVKEERTLADGSKAMCYVFQTRSVPHEHAMG